MVNSQSLFKSNDDIYRTCDNSIHSKSMDTHWENGHGRQVMEE